MTVEQALVYLLAAFAGVFLFLGLAQALDDTPPRAQRGRRIRGAPPLTRGSPAARASGGAETSPERVEARSETLVADERVLRTSPAEPETAAAPAREPGADGPARAEDGPLPAEKVHAPATEDKVTPVAGHEKTTSDAIAPAASPAVAPAAPAPGVGHVDLAFIETCMSLCLAGKYHELLTGAEPRLAASDESADITASLEVVPERPLPGQSSHAIAGLWSLVGLARHGRGDGDGARAAFDAGVRWLPSPVSDACPPRVAALSTPVARRLLDLTERVADETADAARIDERIAAARLAAFWLGWRLVAAPGDEGATTLLDTAREALVEAQAEVASAMIRRQEFAGARRFVEDAVERGELPSARGDLLLEFLGASFRREVERLTTAAVRGSKDESRAVTGLGRAEALLGSMPAGSVGAQHRAAAAGRVWRAHARLGFRRLRLGQFDAAAEALCHALSMREIGRRRQRQVRDALVRTLEGLGDQRAQAIDALVADGNHAAAAEEVAALERWIARARDEGVSEEELEVTSVKLHDLRRRLVGADVPP